MTLIAADAMILKHVLNLSLGLLLTGTGAAAMAAPPAAPVRIVPHRAVYQMNLAQNRQASQVVNAEGTMTFSWGDACDGWTNEQKLQMKYYYAQGQMLESTISNASWEAKDGSRYDFTARNTSSTSGSELFRGAATLDQHGGRVSYNMPKDRQMVLKAGTMFPNRHTAAIIYHAQRGDKMPNTVVFDGGDEDGQSEISIFIGNPSGPDLAQWADPALQRNSMLQGPSWPVRMAFYPLKDNDAGTPDYEMTMDLLPNGIARSVLVDYGDFSVRGVLTAIETLPGSGC